MSNRIGRSVELRAVSSPDSEIAAEADGQVGVRRISRERDSLSLLAYKEIRSALMQGNLKPGETLILRPLATQLGLSPTPVREALQRLASEQALELDERGRAKVPNLTRQTFVEIRDLRALLEGRSAQRAALIAIKDQIDELENIHDQMIVAEESRDYSTALVHNENFHLSLCAIAQMPTLLRIVEMLWLQCGPYLHLVYEGKPAKWPRHPHLCIIDGLRQRDEQLTYAAIVEDIVCYGYTKVSLTNGFPKSFED